MTALDTDLDHFNNVASGLDVEIEPRTEGPSTLGIKGPRARDLLQSLTDQDGRDLRYFHFLPGAVNVGGVPSWVSRTGYSGELGYEVFCSPDEAEQLWAAVTGAGARPYGLAAVETIRIESGLIFIGYDYFQHETSPYDMWLDKVIRLDGRLLGKAALAETAKSPPRRLVTLEVEGERGARVRRGRHQGRRAVGTLTSPCESPTLGKVIGMAVLETSTPGRASQCEVALGDGAANATVADVPSYDPEKTRPQRPRGPSASSAGTRGTARACRR